MYLMGNIPRLNPDSTPTQPLTWSLPDMKKINDCLSINIATPAISTSIEITADTN